ncbi:MAG: redoxin family protein [Phycisphaerales bacterium]|nr:redoxin family protein [Phycisphaerales bacterium]
MFRRIAFLSAALIVSAGAATTLAQDSKPGPANKEAAQPKAEIKKIGIGDKAPDLKISTWVKGEPVTEFRRDQVYVVEFWATWCGPCIAGMPHVSEVQKEYAEKNVRVIGVNIWDDPKNVEPFMKDKGGNDKMKYTVAIEEKYEGDKNVRQGKMSNEWMKAAGQNGIPSAFIVDKTGTIAWIGHPMSMDEPLKEIVAGTWDAKGAAEKAKKQAENEGKLQKLYGEINAAADAKDVAKLKKLLGEMKELSGMSDDDMAGTSFSFYMKAGATDEAYAAAKAAIAGKGKKNSMLMNTIAWTIVDPENPVAKPDYDVALSAAEAACEASGGKDAAILDTYATCLFKKGQIDKAIEIQTKAVGLAADQMKGELQARLDEFKKAKK